MNIFDVTKRQAFFNIQRDVNADSTKDKNGRSENLSASSEIRDDDTKTKKIASEMIRSLLRTGLPRDRWSVR